MLTCLHHYMRTLLHACAYMFAHLYVSTCVPTCMFTYSHVGPLGAFGDPWGPRGNSCNPWEPLGALGIPGDIWEILCASRNPASPSSVSSGARKLQHSGNVAIKMEQTPGEKSGEHVPGCGAQVACAGQSVPEAPFSTIRALPSVHQVHQKGGCHGPGSK